MSHFTKIGRCFPAQSSITSDETSLAGTLSGRDLASETKPFIAPAKPSVSQKAEEKQISPAPSPSDPNKPKKESNDEDKEDSEEDIEPVDVLLQFIPYYGQGDPSNDR
jgi:hypothetical protein